MDLTDDEPGEIAHPQGLYSNRQSRTDLYRADRLVQSRAGRYVAPMTSIRGLVKRWVCLFMAAAAVSATSLGNASAVVIPDSTVGGGGGAPFTCVAWPSDLHRSGSSASVTFTLTCNFDMGQYQEMSLTGTLYRTAHGHSKNLQQKTAGNQCFSGHKCVATAKVSNPSGLQDFHYTLSYHRLDTHVTAPAGNKGSANLVCEVINLTGKGIDCDSSWHHESA